MGNDDWKRVVANPEALVEGEKETWLKIEKILDELFEELKTNGKIETVFTQSEIVHLKKLIKNRNGILADYNLLIDIADKEQMNAFMNKLKNFGFEETNIAYLLIGMAVLLTISDTETFKTALLFHLKDVSSFKASKFSAIMEKNAPNSWYKLKPFIDNDFRNALAHGTWAMENNQVVLFEDAKLIPFQKLDFGDFIGKVMEQDRLLGCLINTVSEKTYSVFSVDT